MKLALGLDVGGTKLAGVLMTEEGTITAKNARRAHGEEGGEAVLRRLIELAEGLLGEAQGSVIGIGIATPGIVDILNGSIRFVTTELPDWSELPISRKISRHFGLPVMIDNDGRAAALAEHRLGVGRGLANFVTIVLGTGVGGGVIANTELVRGAHGGGGRLGHISVEPNGPVCTCGNRGCLELFASGLALASAAKAAISEGRRSVLGQAKDQEPPLELSGRDVVEAALAGDSLAREVVRSAGQRLGQAIVQLNRILDPERIAVGGSISAAGDLMLGPAREFVASHCPAQFQVIPDIVRAQFGRDASVVGAALLGWEVGRHGAPK